MKFLRQYTTISISKHQTFSPMSSVCPTASRRIGISQSFLESSSKRPSKHSTRKLLSNNRCLRSVRIYQSLDTDNHVKTPISAQVYSTAAALASQNQITRYITRSIPQRAMSSSYSKSRRTTNKRYRDCTNVDIAWITW